MSFGRASRDVYHMTGSDNPGAADYIKPTMAWSKSLKTRSSGSRKSLPLPKAPLKQDPRHHRKSELTAAALAKHVKALGLPPASITEHVIPGLVPDEQKKTIYQILTEDNESFKELPLLPMDVINKPLRAEEELPSKPTAFYDQRKFQHESNYAASIRAEQKRAADGAILITYLVSRTDT